MLNERRARSKRARPHHHRAEFRKVYIGQLLRLEHADLEAELAEHRRDVVADATDVGNRRLRWKLGLHRFQLHSCCAIESERTNVFVARRYIPSNELLIAARH